MTYDPYADDYASSTSSYGPSFEPPAAQGPNSNQGYGPPQPSYDVPAAGYTAPQTGYAAPGYGQPYAQPGYAIPGQPYAQPGYAIPGQPYAPGFAPYGQPLAPYANPALAYDPNSPGAPLFNATPVQAFKRFWSKGFTFTGRASRSEYWWMAMWQAVIYFAILAFTLPLGGAGAAGALLSILLLWGYILAFLIPSLSLQARRLHDTNQSGWLLLLHLIPYLGTFIIFILTLMPSKPEGARYDY